MLCFDSLILKELFITVGKNMVRFSLERLNVPRWALFALLSCINTSTNEVYHFER